MTSPIVEKPDRAADLIASLDVLPPELDGRKNPFFPGYHPNHDFGLGGLNDAKHYPVDSNQIIPGDVAQSEVYLSNPKMNAGRLYAGMPFTVQEGGRLVAYAEIDHVVTPLLVRADDRCAHSLSKVSRISFDEFEALRKNDTTTVLDVRPAYTPKVKVTGAIPASELAIEKDENFGTTLRDGTLVIVCDFGPSSIRVAALLISRGFDDVRALDKGLSDGRGKLWRVGPI